MKTYPALTRNIQCEIAVLGAGISGAIIADRLVREGFNVVVLDRRDVCMGSTSASTALLQYDIDITLIDLAKKIGLESAKRAYTLSYQSINDVEELASGLPNQCDFQKKTSVYLARDRRVGQSLRLEAIERRKCGFDVEFLESPELRDRFNIDGPAAIVSSHAASVDPYKFAHLLLARTIEKGGQVYDRTAVEKIESSESDVVLTTDKGHTVTAKQVVVATGYEGQSMLTEQVVSLKSTYACVSQPLVDLKPWDPDWMLWEAKTPYLYMRTTADRRLLVGGEDDSFRDSIKRDRSLPKKVEIIRKKVQELLPSLEWEVEFSWAGTFGETKDGLAYIGPNAEHPRCIFLLGYGGNGITFSAIGASLISDLLKNNANPDLQYFRFGR